MNKPFEAVVESIKEHAVNDGIKYYEVNDDGDHKLNKERIKILNEMKGTYDIKYSVHARWCDTNIASYNEGVREVVIKQLIESMNNAYQLESECWVFHPGSPSELSYFHFNKEEAINIQSVRIIEKEAHNFGIKIAIENMPNKVKDIGKSFLMVRTDEFTRFFDEVEGVGLAFDIGHANTVNQIEEYIERFGSRIVHLHIQDNDGIYDEHKELFEGNIDWEKVFTMISKSGYDGIYCVESIANPDESIKTLKRML